jgi:hypothetical protein
MSSCYIKEDQFIRSLVSICMGQLHWVSGIPEVDEAYSFDSTSIPYIKAWYDSLFQHSPASSSSENFPS